MSPTHRRAAIAAGVTFAVHLVLNPHYGFFRDELYFIICGRHPAWGYVDQPPLTPLLAALSQLLGPSLVLLRAVAAAFAAGSMFVTCLLAEELGGGAFAQLFAGMVAALCPVLCNFGMKVSTDTVGLWLWPWVVLILVRLTRGANPRAWLLVGTLLGLSALAKYSVAYFAVAFLAGLLMTKERRILLSRWFVAGAGIAIVIALPNLLWQASRGFPMLELLRNGQLHKNVILSPLAFLGAELLITNPILALVWLGGLGWLLSQPKFRFMGLGYLVLMATMIASHAKHYYPADIYPALFAAGGVLIERATVGRKWVRGGTTALALSAGLVLIPYVLPVLPMPMFREYHAFIGPKLHLESAKTERGEASELPQDYADMQGWQELADGVAAVFERLPPQERAHATIVASNYGEAAAIDFFGEARGLPPVVSGHNQYFDWGPRGADGAVLIDVNGDCGADDNLFREVERGATVSVPLVMPFERDLPIMVCRGIQKPFAKVWPSLKLYR